MTQVGKMIFDEGWEKGIATGEAKVISMIRKKMRKGLEAAGIAEELELDRTYVDRVVYLLTEDTARSDIQAAEILVKEGR